MRRSVWVYWENPIGQDAVPHYITLCLQTIRRAAGQADVYVLDADAARRVAPSLPAWWSQLDTLAHKADILKAHLLYHHGGLVLDADTIAIRDCAFIFEELERGHEFLGFGPDGNPSLGVLAARRGSLVAHDWLANQIAAYLRNEEGWEVYGTISLSPAALKHGYLSLPWHLTHPIPWYEWQRFLSDESAEMFADGTFAMFSLFNKMIGSSLANATEDELLTGPSLLSQLFRIAFVDQDRHRYSRRQVTIANGRA